MRAELGLTDGQTAVLYTPTWRDDLVFKKTGPRDFEFAIDLDDFSARLGDDHVLLLRLHNMVMDRLEIAEGSAVRDVCGHPDIRDLYLAADVMVTDYSSTMFDFAVTGKPLLFLTYDLEYFSDELRGFYFDLAEVAPTPLLRTSAELVEALADLDAVTARSRRALRPLPRDLLLPRGRARHRARPRPDLPRRTPCPPPPRTPEEGTTVRIADRALDAGPATGLLELARSASASRRSAPGPVQVVILAAGMGTRLGRPHPKPLTPLHDGRSILQRQLDTPARRVRRRRST